MSTTVSYVRDKQTILLKRVATLEKAKDRVLVYGEPLFLKDLNIIIIGDGILDKHGYLKDESQWTVTGSTVQELYDAKKYFISAKPGTLYGTVNYDSIAGGTENPTKANIKSLAGDTKLANTKYVTDVKNQVFAVVDDEKMAKANPTGTGSISINRLASSTVGTNSAVFGNSNTASGNCSFAEGYNNATTANYAHVEGTANIANGVCSHVEGGGNFASESYTHAEGYCTKASSANQHVQGKYNIEDSASKYADIIGNGTAEGSRSNAFALDWDGNGYYAGKVYANHDFTSNVDPQKMLINAGIVAGEYDSRATYSVGQLVFSDNRLYRCKSPVIGRLIPIAPPGVAWEEVTIGGALDKLDTTISNATNKTITALNQTNGLISATFSDIAITYDQVSNGTTKKPLPADSDPLMDGTASKGSDTIHYALDDHRHPTDTSRASTSDALGDITYSNNKFQKKKVADSGYTDIVSISTLKSDMALNNVTNESKATMFTSPTFTGDPKSVTPATSDNDTSIATTAFVHNVMATYGQFIFYQSTQPDIGSMPLTPAEKALPRLWINSTNGLMKVWNGSTWNSVYSIWG